MLDNIDAAPPGQRGIATGNGPEDFIRKANFEAFTKAHSQGLELPPYNNWSRTRAEWGLGSFDGPDGNVNLSSQAALLNRHPMHGNTTTAHLIGRVNDLKEPNAAINLGVEMIDGKPKKTSSACHAVLVTKLDKDGRPVSYQLADLGSTNGTSFDGVEIPPYTLQNVVPARINSSGKVESGYTVIHFGGKKAYAVLAIPPGYQHHGFRNQDIAFSLFEVESP